MTLPVQVNHTAVSDDEAYICTIWQLPVYREVTGKRVQWILGLNKQTVAQQMEELYSKPLSV